MHFLPVERRKLDLDARRAIEIHETPRRAISRRD
jgi:hypothetical protein